MLIKTHVGDLCEEPECRGEGEEASQHGVGRLPNAGTGQ